MVALCLSLAVVGCGATSHVGGEGESAGGASSTGGATGATGSEANPWPPEGPVSGVFEVFAATVNERVQYSEVGLEGVPDGNDRVIMATVMGDSGEQGYSKIRLPETAAVGTYTCDNDSTEITTHLTCCPFTYFSTNTAPRDCSVTFSEVTDSTLVGTFEGLLYDDNGGRLVLREGRFELRVAE